MAPRCCVSCRHRCSVGTVPALPVQLYPPTPDSSLSLSAVCLALLSFEGGGWCTSLDSCYDRGYGKGRRKGSSVGLPDPFDLISSMNSWGNWYFSNLTDDGQGHNLNPVMHDWNMLQVLYCDGASWTGRNTSTTMHKGKQLHFRGKDNLDALIEDLLTNKGMDKATEVVISGGSAGALAVYLHADAIRAKLPKSAKVVAMPDDGL